MIGLLGIIGSLNMIGFLAGIGSLLFNGLLFDSDSLDQHGLLTFSTRSILSVLLILDGTLDLIGFLWR